MRFSFYMVVLSLVAVLFGCKEDIWEDHYGVYPETVDQNIWDAMNENEHVSQFVQVLKEHQFDTLFQTGDAYTLFAPSNDVLISFLENHEMDTTILKYHLSEHFIHLANISGIRKIRTFSEKFAIVEREGNVATLDGIMIDFESPLYKNGKYFIIDQVALPKPNLYEYFAENNQVLVSYIDSQDSIILDRQLSVPIGFDDNGNTIYDSVSFIYNEFEETYFKVSEEFRNRTATIVFPLKEDYDNALTEMAQYIGGSLTDYRDIPLVWQHEVLVPYLLERGVFDNMVEPVDFLWRTPVDTLKLMNILGDSVQILYSPVDRAICSNGYAYNYQEFKVPDSLYKENLRFEAESLLEETGLNKYAWREHAKVISDEPFEPFREFILTASNDSIMRVLFRLGYSGNYSLEFKTDYLFPRRYVMVVRTHMDVGGIYDIYVNDELVNTFDYYEYLRYFGGVIYSVRGEPFIPQGRFNKFDMYVDNITEFGKATIRFEYRGPGEVSTNGLVIDYIDFVPVN